MTITRLVVIASLLVAVAAPNAHASGREVAYAIVIGNNAPPSTGTPEKLAPLRYADDDAVRYFQLFSRMAYTRLLVVLDTQTQRRYPGLAAYTEAPTLANFDRVVDHDRYRRAVAVCSAGAVELNRRMVEDGWAIAYERFPSIYSASEERARAMRRGLWQGYFDRPRQWRDSVQR